MSKGAEASPRRESVDNEWQSDIGVEPTQDGITAPQTVLKSVFSLLTRVKPGPHRSTCSLWVQAVQVARWQIVGSRATELRC